MAQEDSCTKSGSRGKRLLFWKNLCYNEDVKRALRKQDSMQAVEDGGSYWLKNNRDVPKFSGYFFVLFFEISTIKVSREIKRLPKLSINSSALLTSTKGISFQ